MNGVCVSVCVRGCRCMSNSVCVLMLALLFGCVCFITGC